MSPNRTRHLFAAITAVAVILPALLVPRDAAGQTPAGEPYKIGVTYPLSGPQGAWGQLLVPAMEIAVQHVNQSGGVEARQRQAPVRVLPEHADRETKLGRRPGCNREAWHPV